MSFFSLQSFDRDGDFEQEVLRRNSASLAQSGLYSSSIDGSTISINIDPEAGYTCKLLCLDFLWCALFRISPFLPCSCQLPAV